jgi:hypothetical protein
LTQTGTLRPPTSFFVNRDTLFDTLGFEPLDPHVTDIRIPADVYVDCLRQFDVHRSDGSIRVEGDVHFAFLTPEPAFEDTDLADRMLQDGLLSARFLASLSMTDFTNPVFSNRRAKLLRYVPEEISGTDHGTLLEQQFVQALTTAIVDRAGSAANENSPEREFLANWNAPNIAASAVERLTLYFEALQAGRLNSDVIEGWFRLAEYRRRRFRDSDLAEFDLTTPRTNIPEDAAPLRMTVLGRVEAE